MVTRGTRGNDLAALYCDSLSLGAHAPPRYRSEPPCDCRQERGDASDVRIFLGPAMTSKQPMPCTAHQRDCRPPSNGTLVRPSVPAPTMRVFSRLITTMTSLLSTLSGCSSYSPSLHPEP